MITVRKLKAVLTKLLEEQIIDDYELVIANELFNTEDSEELIAIVSHKERFVIVRRR